MPYKDPEKNREYQRKYQRNLRKNPEYTEYLNEKNKENMRKKRENPEFKAEEEARFNKNYYHNKIRAIKYTGGLRCHNPDCGWKGEIPLCGVDFHHVLSQNKTNSFSNLFRTNWEKVKEEIDNCKAIPLCSICHMVEEYGTDEERFRDILDE